MNASELYNIIAPIVSAWNIDRPVVAQLTIKKDDDLITITPFDTPHLPGPVLSDIAMLAAVYGFSYGVHVNDGQPYILL